MEAEAITEVVDTAAVAVAAAAAMTEETKAAEEEEDNGSHLHAPPRLTHCANRS